MRIQQLIHLRTSNDPWHRKSVRGMNDNFQNEGSGGGSQTPGRVRVFLSGSSFSFVPLTCFKSPSASLAPGQRPPTPPPPRHLSFSLSGEMALLGFLVPHSGTTERPGNVCPGEEQAQTGWAAASKSPKACRAEEGLALLWMTVGDRNRKFQEVFSNH